jgi:hypothetical protein
MTARPHEKDEEPPAAVEPLDSEFVRMIRQSLDDPRRSITGEEVRRRMLERHEAYLKRQAAN